jgi:hypothetical protein
MELETSRIGELFLQALGFVLYRKEVGGARNKGAADPTDSSYESK